MSFIRIGSGRTRFGHSGFLASGSGFGSQEVLPHWNPQPLLYVWSGPYLELWLAALILNVTQASFTFLIRSPTIRHSKLVLEQGGTALYPVCIRVKSLKLGQHPINAVPNWLEHVFFILMNASIPFTVFFTPMMRFSNFWNALRMHHLYILVSDSPPSSGPFVTSNAPLPSKISSHIR